MKERDFDRLAGFFRQRKGVIVAYVFGSEARGKAGKLSDVDIAVSLDESIPRTDYLRLKLDIIAEASSILKTDRIDLVIMNTAPLLLNHNIVKFGRVLTSDEPERAKLEKVIMSRYLDHRPMLEKRTAMNLRKIARAGL